MNSDSVQSQLPALVEITTDIVKDYAGRGKLSELVIRLYREAISICTLCAAAYVDQPDKPMSRNQAICAGLLVRIVKFMVPVNHLATPTERADVIMALNRSITESVTNLKFLIAKGDNDLYDKYVAASLGTEREFYDLVQKEIRRRGVVLSIDESILKSIDRVAKLSDIDIRQVDERFKDFAGSLRYRYEELGQSAQYVTQERMGSHAVHGTWVDLVLNHLNAADNGFVTNFDWGDSDGQLLAPIAVLGLDAARDYINEFFGETANLGVLVERIEDLIDRILKVELSREDWIPTVDDSAGA